jgi:hypothetical protein
MSSPDSAARPDLITLALPYQTNIPLFPEDSSNSETIDIAVASEFKDYSFPATAIDASHKVVVTVDGDDEPMIFSIGTDSVGIRVILKKRYILKYNFYSGFIAFAMFRAMLGSYMISHLEMRTRLFLCSMSRSTEPLMKSRFA